MLPEGPLVLNTLHIPRFQMLDGSLPGRWQGFGLFCEGFFAAMS